MATRVASQKALEVLNPLLPFVVGGSADLTGSNNTKTGSLDAVTPSDRSGRYVHYGVREHGMAAIMNGMALHGFFTPYGGTFLVFTDYCRPAIRLSALMDQRVIYVMTHDSIGLGEDGPTHQPIEHLAALRAMPNLLVFRPADAVETAEAWQHALTHDGPSVLCLTRQGLPTMRQHVAENRSAEGAYILKDAEAPHQATLMATGSEVSIMMEAAQKLEAQNIGTRVLSMPCMELINMGRDEFREKLVGSAQAVVAMEAASSWGWDRYVGDHGAMLRH
jgi:Transketolase